MKLRVPGVSGSLPPSATNKHSSRQCTARHAHGWVGSASKQEREARGDASVHVQQIDRCDRSEVSRLVQTGSAVYTGDWWTRPKWNSVPSTHLRKNRRARHQEQRGRELVAQRARLGHARCTAQKGNRSFPGRLPSVPFHTDTPPVKPRRACNPL